LYLLLTFYGFSRMRTHGAKPRIERRDIWPNILRLQSRLPAILFVDLPSDNNQLCRLGRSINLAAIIYADYADFR
jgi:hypothetical protein